MVVGNSVRDKGQGMLEFVVAFPVVLLAVAGVIQLTWVFLAQSMLHSATNHIADYASVQPEHNVELLQIFWHRMKPIPQHGFSIPDIRVQVDEETLDASFWEQNENDHITLLLDVPYWRMSELNEEEKELYLRARTPHLEITWCFPMRVPVVNLMIEQMSNNACQLEGMTGTPHIQLQSSMRFTMQANWTILRD